MGGGGGQHVPQPTKTTPIPGPVARTHHHPQPHDAPHYIPDILDLAPTRRKSAPPDPLRHTKVAACAPTAQDPLGVWNSRGSLSEGRCVQRTSHSRSRLQNSAQELNGQFSKMPSEVSYTCAIAHCGGGLLRQP